MHKITTTEQRQLNTGNFLKLISFDQWIVGGFKATIVGKFQYITDSDRILFDHIRLINMDVYNVNTVSNLSIKSNLLC